MPAIALQGSGLHGTGHDTHIVFGRTDPLPTSVLPTAAYLAQVKHQRVYFPQGTLPWQPMWRPTRKTDHAQFRSEP
jgi:predicted esterase